MDKKYKYSPGALLALEHGYLPVLKECGPYHPDEAALMDLLGSIFPEIKEDMIRARNKIYHSKMN